MVERTREIVDELHSEKSWKGNFEMKFLDSNLNFQKENALL